MSSWIVLTVAVVLILAAIIIFNRLVGARQMANEAWSGIDVQLKRRSELIPNLVNTVQGYVAHERDVLTRVTQLRTAANALPADDVARRAQAEGALSVALNKLIAVAESYPDLKASANFLSLQQQLATLEDDLQMARRYYNGAVRNQNILVQSFPNNLIAGPLGFAPRGFFELADGSEAAVPKVAV
jgi:LemA protein